MPRPLSLSCTVRLLLLAVVCVSVFVLPVEAQRRRSASGGSARAVVVDERLSALRDEPDVSARLLQRLSRGHIVSIMGTRRAADGTTFYRVAVTRRTRGWLQAECLVSPARDEDDDRLLRFINGSTGFNRIARAQIFLDTFRRSSLRSAVLLIHAEALETAAATLSRDATRRLIEAEMTAGGAPVHTYFLR
jgi:hypothetical protein